MHTGFKVGKILGINIYIDWSWIFIFLLVTWNLAGAVFPSIHPDWSAGLNIVMGSIAALLFFISILLHELAHSVVAKARGLPVRRITLFIFGGTSNIERDPSSPKTEFLMAVVGPITSILLGVGFIWLGTQNIDGMSAALNTNNPASFLSRIDPLSTMLLWLGPINILIGVFNLIPGFPMDGGRILRAVLWQASGNFLRATRWATIVGQVIGWLMVIAGIAMVFGVSIPFFGSGIISGLWLAFIGWFLMSAASQSYQRVLLEDMLEGIPINRLIREPPAAVLPNLTISSLVYDHLMRDDENAIPVIEGGHLLGMVYLKNIRNIDRSEWDTNAVKDVMVPENELQVVTPQDDAMNAFQKMTQQELRQIPVVQNGVLIGMLRLRDFMRWLRMHSEMTGGKSIS